MSKWTKYESGEIGGPADTLDLTVLKVLKALGPLHGYGIARRIEQVSEQVLQLKGGGWSMLRSCGASSEDG